MKNIVILGSTGSIGTQTLDIADRLPDRLRVVGLAVRSNVQLVARQAAERGVEHVCVGEGFGVELAGKNFRVYEGVEGMCALASMPGVDLVVMEIGRAS